MSPSLAAFRMHTLPCTNEKEVKLESALSQTCPDALHPFHCVPPTTLFRLQSCWHTASGPPPRMVLIEMDATRSAGMRPPLFSSTHCNDEGNRVKVIITSGAILTIWVLCSSPLTLKR